MTTPPATDDALLKTLATACGASVTKERQGISDFKATAPWIAHYELSFSEETAWHIIISTAPDWRHSVDAALALPWPGADSAGYWTLHAHKILGRSSSASLTHYKVFSGSYVETDVYLTSDQALGELARALCEVFAAWWTATHGEGKEGT